MTRVPARARRRRAAQAEAIALARRGSPRRIDYVGVLCVEFFVLADGALVANEMAPRPHNSGHYSIDACDLSQFDAAGARDDRRAAGRAAAAFAGA